MTKNKALTRLSNPNETTEAFIDARVFRGAGPAEFRGLSDAFTEAEILAISQNPGVGIWAERAVEILGAL